MLDHALEHLQAHGIPKPPDVVVADAGYCHTRQITAIQDRGLQVLLPPDGGMRDRARPGWEHGFYDQTRQALATETGRLRYGHAQDHDRARLRPDQIQPWHHQVHASAASHNLLKLHSHWTANTA